MGKLLASSIVTVAVLAGASMSLQAQEANRQTYGTLEGQSEVRENEPNGEAESSGPKHQVRQDSVSFKSPLISVKKPVQEVTKSTAKKGDEDAVSFNFLYYIIQRFKTSDIIED